MSSDVVFDERLSSLMLLQICSGSVEKRPPAPHRNELVFWGVCHNCRRNLVIFIYFYDFYVYIFLCLFEYENVLYSTCIHYLIWRKISSFLHTMSPFLWVPESPSFCFTFSHVCREKKCDADLGAVWPIKKKDHYPANGRKTTYPIHSLRRRWRERERERYPSMYDIIYFPRFLVDFDGNFM